MIIKQKTRASADVRQGCFGVIMAGDFSGAARLCDVSKCQTRMVKFKLVRPAKRDWPSVMVSLDPDPVSPGLKPRYGLFCGGINGPRGPQIIETVPEADHA